MTVRPQRTWTSSALLTGKWVGDYLETGWEETIHGGLRKLGVVMAVFKRWILVLVSWALCQTDRILWFIKCRLRFPKTDFPKCLWHIHCVPSRAFGIGDMNLRLSFFSFL